jgi:hypothetical protein
MLRELWERIKNVCSHKTLKRTAFIIVLVARFTCGRVLRVLSLVKTEKLD